MVVAAAVYLAVAVAATWPLLPLAWDHFVHPWADALLVAWILAWDVHVLGTAPTRLFEANAFHPAAHALAYSEHLLGDLWWFAPVAGPTGNPVFAVNAGILASFVLSGLGMHWVARTWTGSTLGAYAAGLAWMLAPWHWPALGSPHLLQVQWLPPIALATAAAVRSGRRAPALVAGLLVALQALSSFYLGYQAFLVAAIALGVATTVDRPPMRHLAPPLAAFAAAAVLLVPLALPYVRLRQTSGIGFAWTDPGLAELAAALGTPGTVVRDYVGWGALVVGLAGAWTLRHERRRGHLVGPLVALALVAAGFALAPGPAGLASVVRPFAWLAAVVPGFASQRFPVRFGVLASFGTAVLVACAVAAARRRARPWSVLLPALALAAVVAPAVTRERTTPRQFPLGAAAPAVHRWLAAHGDGGPVLTLPRGPVPDARAMLYSTLHWLPLLNGFSGYLPRPTEFLGAYVEQLPAPDAVGALVDCAGLRWIVTEGRTPHPSLWTAPGSTLLRERFHDPAADARVYEVTAARRAPCDPAWHPDTTARGAPVVRGVDLTGYAEVAGLAEPLVARASTIVRVTVTPATHAVWPGTATDPAARVWLVVAWTPLDGGRAPHPDDIPFPRDLRADAPAAVSVALAHPPAPGRWRLVLRARQGGDRWTPATAPPLLEREVVVAAAARHDAPSGDDRCQTTTFGPGRATRANPASGR